MAGDREILYQKKKKEKEKRKDFPVAFTETTKRTHIAPLNHRLDGDHHTPLVFVGAWSKHFQFFCSFSFNLRLLTAQTGPNSLSLSHIFFLLYLSGERSESRRRTALPRRKLAEL